VGLTAKGVQNRGVEKNDVEERRQTHLFWTTPLDVVLLDDVSVSTGLSP
jgi:hypothetical protein